MDGQGIYAGVTGIFCKIELTVHTYELLHPDSRDSQCHGWLVSSRSAGWLTDRSANCQASATDPTELL